MQYLAAGLLCIFLLAAPASATIIVRWSFNASTNTPTYNAPDGTTTTVSPTGRGLDDIDLVQGVPTFGAVPGTPTTAFPSLNFPADPATVVAGTNYDRAYRVTYEAGAPTAQRGFEIRVDTRGWYNPKLSFSALPSDMSSRFWLVQYTVDGVNYTNTLVGPRISTVQGANTRNSVNGYIDVSNIADSTALPAIQRHTLDFSGIATAANNQFFGIRIVAAHAPNTNAYQTADTNSTTPNHRNLAADWAIIEATAIPEPSTMAMALAGLIALVGSRQLRRRVR